MNRRLPLTQDEFIGRLGSWEGYELVGWKIVSNGLSREVPLDFRGWRFCVQNADQSPKRGDNLSRLRRYGAL